MRKLLIINSFTGIIQLVVNAGLIFLVIPIFIKDMGMEKYGIFSLLLLIGNLNSFVNLGLNSSLIKFLSEQGKTTESNHDIFVAFFILLMLLVPLTIVAIIFKQFFLLNIFNIPQRYYTSEIINFYVLLIIANFFVLLSQISSAILDAQQKIYLTNLFQIIYNFLYWSLILLALKLFKNFESIGFGILIAALTWFVAVTISAFYHWGKVQLKGIFQSFPILFKKQLSYGLKIYFSGTLNFFYEPITKIILSKYLGLNEVGLFDIGLKVRQVVWNMFSKILYPVYPLISKLTDKNKIRLLVHDIEQKTVYFMVPTALTVIFISYEIAKVWIGKNLTELSITFSFIVIGHLLSIILTPNYQFLTAKNHAGKTIIMQGSNAFFNAVVILLTINYLHYYSAIAGNFAAIFSSFLIGLYYQKKYLNSLLFDNSLQILKLAIFASILFVIGYILNLVITNDYLQIVIIPLVLYLSIIPLFRYLKMITPEDIERYTGENLILKNLITKILVINKPGLNGTI